MSGMVETLAVDREAMRRAASEGFITATAVADALVRRGVPFREAHHVVGRLVGAAEAAGLAMTELGDGLIAAALAESRDSGVMGLAGDPTLPGELRAAATLEAALASCDVIGGTAPRRVAAALAQARARLDAASA